MSRTVFRTCTLCEAMCGLSFEVDGDRIVSVGPDHDDVFSHGYICPKGTAIADVHDDPDRLRIAGAPHAARAISSRSPGTTPSRSLAQRLTDIRAQHGGRCDRCLYRQPDRPQPRRAGPAQRLDPALGTRNCTSAGSQDTSPRFAASYYLYGSSLAVPVPDIDRTDYLLCLGANPRVSQRQLSDGPRHARAAASHSPARRPRGGRRSAPHRDGPRGRRARGHSARRRRGVFVVAGAGDRRRGPRRSRRDRTAGQRLGGDRIAAGGVHARARRAPRRALTPRRFAGWPASSPRRRRRWPIRASAFATTRTARSPRWPPIC